MRPKLRIIEKDFDERLELPRTPWTVRRLTGIYVAGLAVLAAIVGLAVLLLGGWS